MVQLPQDTYYKDETETISVPIQIASMWFIMILRRAGAALMALRAQGLPKVRVHDFLQEPLCQKGESVSLSFSLSLPLLPSLSPPPFFFSTCFFLFYQLLSTLHFMTIVHSLLLLPSFYGLFFVDSFPSAPATHCILVCVLFLSYLRDSIRSNYY